MISISTPSTQLPCVGLMMQDDALRSALMASLTQAGFTCWESRSFNDLAERLQHGQTDVVIYGLAAPAMQYLNELQVLSSQFPIGLIAVPSEQSHDTGKQCLQAGADHYLLKPLDHELVIVMLKALWRRLKLSATGVPAEPVAPGNRWELDEVNNRLIIDQTIQVGLSHQEFEFMDAIMQRPNALMSMPELHQVMFPDFEEVNAHRLSVLLNRLRRKVKAKGYRLPIRSLYGRGLVYMQD